MVPCPPDPGYFPHTEPVGHEGRAGSRGIPELGAQDTVGQQLARVGQHQELRNPGLHLLDLNPRGCAAPNPAISSPALPQACTP